MERTILNLPYVEVTANSTGSRYLIIKFSFYHKGKLHFAKYVWEGSTYLDNRGVSGPHRGDFYQPDHNRFLLTLLTDQHTSGDSYIYSSKNEEVKDLLTPIYGEEPEMPGGWPNWSAHSKYNMSWIISTLVPALNDLLVEKYKNLHTFDLSLEELENQVKF